MIQKNFRGFTLLEILIVLVVIGILATLALPRLFSNIERMRAEEARRILLELLTAQKHYFLENGHYADDLSDLDIEFRITPDNYIMPNDGDIDRNDPIAQVQRVGGAYTVEISSDGVFSCTPGTADAHLCAVITNALNN